MRKVIYDLQVMENINCVIKFSKVKLNHKYRITGKIEDKNIIKEGIFKFIGRIKVFVDSFTNEVFEYVIKDAKEQSYKVKVLFFVETCWEKTDLKRLSYREVQEKAVNNDILNNYDSKCILTLNPYIVRQCIEDGKKMECVGMLLQDTYCYKKSREEPISTSPIKKISAILKKFETRNSSYYWK